MKAPLLPLEYISVQDATQAIIERGRQLILTDQCGFFLCQKGSAEVSLNARTYHLSKGDIYYYMPSTFVGLLNYSPDLEGIAVKCRIDFILPLLEQVLSGDTILAMREHPCISLTSSQQQGIEHLAGILREHLSQLLTRDLEASSRYTLQHLVISLAESLFHQLIFDYGCIQTIQTQVHDKRDSIFQTFLVSLFKNYKRQREVAFYAAEQCLTPRYFSSVVKEKSGHSALQWIIQMVISSTCQILTTTDLSIKEIAMDFNFPSQSFFGKYFKQYVGMSPKEYRLQQRQRLGDN